MSRPAWDAWIEIASSSKPVTHFCGSRPAWDAWIEILMWMHLSVENTSRPAWDAWIEIGKSKPSRARSSRRVPHGTRGLK